MTMGCSWVKVATGFMSVPVSFRWLDGPSLMLLTRTLDFWLLCLKSSSKFVCLLAVTTLRENEDFRNWTMRWHFKCSSKRNPWCARINASLSSWSFLIFCSYVTRNSGSSRNTPANAMWTFRQSSHMMLFGLDHPEHGGTGYMGRVRPRLPDVIYGTGYTSQRMTWMLD